MKKIIIALTILILLFGLSGCETSATQTSSVIEGNFITLEEEGSGIFRTYNGLAYDKDTDIVYYYIYNPYTLTITPYISENGYFCKYVDNEIVEIIN